MTASSLTSQKSAILRLISASRNRSVRHRRMSAWMPIDRRSRTLCCVGFVFSSPAGPVDGTSVRGAKSVPAHTEPNLTEALEDRQTPEAADGAANLDQQDVHVARRDADGILDLVGD